MLILQINNLSKMYGSKQVLEDINITLNEGVYGLLGENGAGKSTLMRILSTVDFQTKGEVLLDGENILSLDDKYRDLLGVMPQDYSVYPSFSAKDFLEYVGALKGIKKQVLDNKIIEVLEFVNLSNETNKKVKNFSGGMKRRLGIAQAVLNDPKILILDEPTAGLDPRERLRFSNIISEMSKDKIVILSTHIISDIEAVANELIIIKKGKLLSQGNINNLISQVDGKVYEAIVNQTTLNEISKINKIVHRKQENDNIKIRYIGDEYDNVNSLCVRPNLEDYYVDLCF